MSVVRVGIAASPERWVHLIIRPMLVVDSKWTQSWQLDSLGQEHTENVTYVNNPWHHFWKMSS